MRLSTRTYAAELLLLSPNGRPCEVCGGHMHEHDWADLDASGMVVACSEQQDGAA